MASDARARCHAGYAYDRSMPVAKPGRHATTTSDERMESTIPCRRLALPAEDEEEAADDDGADTDPDREVDRLLLLDRKLERSELHGRLLLRVREASIAEHEGAGDDEDDGDELGGTHGEDENTSRTRVSRRRRRPRCPVVASIARPAVTSVAPEPVRSAP